MRPTIYPKVNDITMVVPTKIMDNCVYVKLLEYNEIEGFIILSDLSKTRIYSVNKVAPIGRKFPACVLSLEEKTGQITLSKRDVTEKESNLCYNNFRNLKFIQDMLKFYIVKLEKDHNITIDLDTAYQKFIWSLSNDPEFLVFALKSASRDFDKIYQNKLENVNPLWIHCFKQVLSSKFKIKDVLLESILNISCFEEKGVNIIKNALISGTELVTKEYPFNIKLVKSPHYSITIKTSNQEGAINKMNEIITTIRTNAEANGAIFKITKNPEIVIEKEFEPESSECSDEVEND